MLALTVTEEQLRLKLRKMGIREISYRLSRVQSLFFDSRSAVPRENEELKNTFTLKHQDFKKYPNDDRYD
jgi:hypothetical protein